MRFLSRSLFLIFMSAYVLGCESQERFNIQQEPTCTLEGKNAPDLASTNMPMKKLNFIVRILNKDLTPVANTQFLYTYASNDETVGSGDRVGLFSEVFTTDSDGYLVYVSEGEKELVVTGYSSGSSSASSSGIGVFLGFLGAGGTSSSTHFDQGFTIRVKEEKSLILLSGSNYSGTVRVLTKGAGKGVVTAALETHEVENIAVSKYVRPLNLGIGVEGGDDRWFGNPAHKQMSEDFDKINVINRANLQATGTPTIDCPALMALNGKDYLKGKSLGTATMHITFPKDENECENYRKEKVDPATCDSNWQRSVIETFVLKD